MINLDVKVDDHKAYVEQSMLQDARSKAVDHFHSTGKQPGLYLAAFSGGVSKKETKVVGWVRNNSPLAHLLENGFTISDLLIDSNNVMAFQSGVQELYAYAVHRHATKVQAYPAIGPAFEAHKGEVITAAEQAVQGL